MTQCIDPVIRGSMANDTDLEQFVVNSKGLKREHANAEAQSQIGGAHGLDQPDTNRDPVQFPANKRSKPSGSLHENQNGPVEKNEEEAKREVVDAETVSENEEPRTGFVSQTASTSKKIPSWKLKDLLASGILEGMSVHYVKGKKAKNQDGRRLKGVIRGTGIVCSCENCKGNEVVGVTVFEKHADSGHKRPAEYIKLDNGNNLRDVMNACSDIPLANLEEAVQNVLAELTMQKSTFCFNCRGSFKDADAVSKLLCNSCTALKDCPPSPTPTTENSNTCVSPSVESRSPKPDVLPKGMKRTPSHGKNLEQLTKKKDLQTHKAVFGELAEGAELYYKARGQILLVGHKVENGIRCTCCNTVVSPSQFEAHAGCASRRKPYLQIYTSDMVSLHQLSISLLKNRSISTKENVDFCSSCSNGGDLLCCDKCIRAFHLKCVPLPRIPSGFWYCRYCQNETQGNKDVERQRRSLVVEHDEGGQCALCSGHDFIKDVFGPLTVILCDQCEREYHVECLKDHNMQSLEKLPDGKWFCCSGCDYIHNVLVKLVARGEMNLPDSLLSLIEKKPEEKDIESEAGLDIKWRVLNWNLVDPEELMSLFSNVFAIFHEEFDPIVDPTTGLDFIVEMVYGKKSEDHDFRGMYCAVLTINQVVVCACLFRVFGQEVAELPLVATRKDCQGQGYFRSLFSCIERMLGFLKVKNLVLPSATEAKSLWTTKFGFRRLGREKVDNYLKYNDIVAFQGTSFLRKPIPQLQKIQHGSISGNIVSQEAYSCAARGEHGPGRSKEPIQPNPIK